MAGILIASAADWIMFTAAAIGVALVLAIPVYEHRYGKERKELVDREGRLEEAFSAATWDLATYTFRGEDTSLGEEAERLRAFYLSRADP